jgi:hypothetical protein
MKLSVEHWAALANEARLGPVRPAFLQRELRRDYEAAVEVLDTGVAVGVLEARGKGVTVAAARCSACYERRMQPPTAQRQFDSIREPIPPQLRFRVLQRDGFRCQYCGRSARDGAILHLDHVVPVAAGGPTSEGNLITSCETCNFGKSALTVVPD